MYKVGDKVFIVVNTSPYTEDEVLKGEIVSIKREVDRFLFFKNVTHHFIINTSKGLYKCIDEDLYDCI